MDTNLKKEITDRLRSQKLYKVLLFGSQAVGQEKEYSDIEQAILDIFKRIKILK